MVSYEFVGKRAGVVTTARLTHASPAAAFAHAADRGWESDSDLPEDAVGVCPDIASQFIDNPINNRINVSDANQLISSSHSTVMSLHRCSLEVVVEISFLTLKLIRNTQRKPEVEATAAISSRYFLKFHDTIKICKIRRNFV